MTDPIADMLTRIRGAMAVNKHQIILPYSKIKEDVARLLVANGFLKQVSTRTTDKWTVVVIDINEERQPAAITAIKRVSTPGRRTYVKAKDIPTIKHGRGLVVVSTSKGLMTGLEARAQKLGGELICEVY